MTVAIIYRWRLKPGKQEQFRKAWRRRTVELREEAGALGSALHRTDDDIWVAYARWPNPEERERARNERPANSTATDMMRDATAEDFPPIVAEVIDDLLLGPSG